MENIGEAAALARKKYPWLFGQENSEPKESHEEPPPEKRSQVRQLYSEIKEPEDVPDNREPYYTWPLEWNRKSHEDDFKAIVRNHSIHLLAKSYKNLSRDFIARQTIYIINNCRGYMGSMLNSLLDEYDLEYDYNGGFTGDTFEPDEDYLPEMLEIFSKNSNVFKEASQLVKIKRAMKHFNLNGDIFQIKKFSDFIGETENTVYLSIKQDQFERAHNKEAMAFYAALKSMSGNQPMFKINYSVLIARVMGYTSEEDIPSVLKDSPFYKKYSKRCHRDTMMEILRGEWKVKTAWCGRKVAITLNPTKSQGELNKWAASKIKSVSRGSMSEVLKLKNTSA